MPPILAALKLIILYNTRPALSIANPKNFRENSHKRSAAASKALLLTVRRRERDIYILKRIKRYVIIQRQSVGGAEPSTLSKL